MGCCAWCAMCSISLVGLGSMRVVMLFGLSSIRRRRSWVGSSPPYRPYLPPHTLPLVWAKFRQIVVDTEGNLLTAAVHSANIQDRVAAEPVLNETHDLCPDVTHGWADQSYSGDLVEWAATALGITIEIVKRSADQVGFRVQPRRWVVERTIAWINRCRRLSKDFEHLAKNSVAWIYWASIQRMLRYVAPAPNQERPYVRKTATVVT